nr:MAG TPA: hypothetical protein [Microviridae sp.]
MLSILDDIIFFVGCQLLFGLNGALAPCRAERTRSSANHHFRVFTKMVSFLALCAFSTLSTLSTGFQHKVAQRFSSF